MKPLFIILVLQACLSSAYAQSSSDPNANVAKIFGEVSLVTDSIEHGLTQTDHGPALQTSIGYKWPQFQIGLWGGNVHYKDSSETLNLRLFISTKLNFSQITDLNIRYDMNRYFKTSNRNGGIIGLDLRVTQYHLTYEQNDNWEGLKTRVGRWGLASEWPISGQWFAGGSLGYNMLHASGYDPFFDLKPEVDYRGREINFGVGISFNSKAKQFNGRGDIAPYLNVTAHF